MSSKQKKQKANTATPTATATSSSAQAASKKRTRNTIDADDSTLERMDQSATALSRVTRSSSRSRDSFAVASSSQPASKKTRRTSPVKSTAKSKAKSAKKGGSTKEKKKESKKEQVEEEDEEEEEGDEDKEMVDADDDMAEENNTEEKQEEEFDAEWIARVEAIQRGEESKAKADEQQAKEQEERKARWKEEARVKEEQKKVREQEIHAELKATQLIHSSEARTFVRSHLVEQVDIPNVLSDLIVDYMYSPLLSLWEEIELLCQMHDREKLKVYQKVYQLENAKVKEAKSTSKDEKSEPPKPLPLCTSYVRTDPDSSVVAAASPLAIDQLECEYRAHLNDPTFHFPAELKLLWSIRDGFEYCSTVETSKQNLFDGRLWPSLDSMRHILSRTKIDSSPLTSCQYILLSDSEAQHNYWWWKYDLISGVIWVWGQYEEEFSELYEDLGGEGEFLPRIVFHSLTHFLQCFKSSLIQEMMAYRANGDLYSYREALIDANSVCEYSQDVIKLAQKDRIFLASDLTHLDAKYEEENAQYIHRGSLKKVDLKECDRRVKQIERDWVEHSQKHDRSPCDALILLREDQNLSQEKEN